MPQFVIDSENITNEEISITNKDDIKHLTNVLRLNEGDKLDLVELDRFTYLAEVLSINKSCIKTKILEKNVADKKLKVDITLAQSIIKSQKQDYIIQKATELGVNTIVPFISKNTVVKIHSDKDNVQKVDKWLKIAYESIKQCERATMPKIQPITSFKNMLTIDNFDVKLVCTERKANLTIKEFLRKKEIADKNSLKVLLIIGPEGGWDDNELKAFNDNNIAQVTLGKLILRAETAVVTALADIIYEYEL